MTQGSIPRPAITQKSPASSGQESGISQIGQIALTVQDLEEAIRFYRDSLGLPFLFQVPRLAFFNCDGIRLMLALPEREEKVAATSVIYFRVAGIHAAHDRLAEGGIAFEQTPHRVASLAEHDLWLASFRDASGNLLALMSEVAR
jgi:predicted enzyme related to lactoylglutathione lyase